jgi:predicted RNA-binding protein with RPS1 domain
VDNKSTKEFGAIKFYRLLLYSVQPDAIKMIEEDKCSIREILGDRLFGDGKLIPVNRSPRRSEGFRVKMLTLMVEVNASVAMLEDIPIYLRRFPFSKYQISKLNYLRHHVEFFLNQIYILQERIIKYLKFIEKSYNKAETKHVSETASKLIKDVCDCLKSPTSIRGTHVHVEQYDEPALHRLEVLEAFIVFGNLSEAQEQFDIMFKKTRRKLVKEISESLTMIEKVLDACFGELATLLDSGNGQLLLPPNYR